MFNLGPTEMLLIVVVALLVFGPERIPEFARTMGKAMREFQRATSEVRHSMRDALDDIENVKPELPDLRKVVGRIDGSAPEISPTRQAFSTSPNLQRPVVAQTPPASEGAVAIGGAPREDKPEEPAS